MRCPIALCRIAAAVWALGAAGAADAWAPLPVHTPTDPGGTTACAAAADAPEQAFAIPHHLLHAIATVESAGQPWSVNVEGAGHHFDSKRAAIDFVRQAAAAGARTIDVGCFQIDLFYHPDAFADLDTAFDPAANAAYAGQFLSALHQGAPDWADAVAFYHSHDPALGGDYRDRVYAALNGRAWGAAPYRTVYAAFGMRVFTPGGPSTREDGLPRVYVP